MKLLKHEALKSLVKFGVVGLIGTIINTFFLWWLTGIGLHYLVASVIATELSVISNFIGNNRFTFKNINNKKSLKKKFMNFQIISLITITGTATLLWLLTNTFGKSLLLVWNLFAIGMMFVLNFLLNKKITWRNRHEI